MVNIDSWDGLLGSNFLKAENVKEEQIFVCIKTEIEEEHNKVRLTLESGEEKTTFDLNVTNSNTIKNAGINSPKDIVGKKIVFKKVLVRNPQTNKEVDGLRIKSLE